MKDTLALSEPDGTLTHSITCVCRLNTAQTAPLCTWVFNGAGSAMEANDPSRTEANYLSNYYDDSWKCGRRLYLHEYKEIQHNELEIVTKEAETLGLVTGFINTLETTVQDRIDIQEPLLQAAYDEVKNEIDTRILNDQTINTAIDNYIIAEDQYLSTSSEESTDFIEDTVAVRYDDLIDYVENNDQNGLLASVEAVKPFITEKLDSLIALNVIRLDKIKDDIETYTRDTGADVKANLVEIIADASDASENAITTQISIESPVLSQTIIAKGDTLISTQSRLLNTKIYELRAILEPVIDTDFANSEGTFTTKIQGVEDSLCTTATDYIAIEESKRVIAAEALQVTLVNQLNAVIADTSTKLLSDIQDQGVPNTEGVTEYIIEKNIQSKININTKIWETQKRMDELNAIARIDAVSRAQLYADDIQRPLDDKLSLRINREREKIQSTLNETIIHLEERVENVAAFQNKSMSEIEEKYNAKLETSLTDLESESKVFNQTMNDELSQIRKTNCEQIRIRGEGAAEVTQMIKQSLSDKIKKLVATVKSEMARSKKLFDNLDASVHLKNN